MTKCDYTLYVYKADKRCKIGERLNSRIQLEPITKNDVERLMSALSTWANKPGYRYEAVSTELFTFDFTA